MNKTQTVELLQKQLPGFYSVDQVIELINGIEDEQGLPAPENIELLTEEIVELIQREGEDLIQDYELSLRDRELELDSISFNTTSLTDLIEDKLKDYFRLQ